MSDDEDILHVNISGSSPRKITVGEYYGELVLRALEDAQRYQWLKEHIFEVNCEGRPADCNAKWMLPRLTAEDSTGKKFTFDEIIDIQMKRGGDEG